MLFSIIYFLNAFFTVSYFYVLVMFLCCPCNWSYGCCASTL